VLVHACLVMITALLLLAANCFENFLALHTYTLALSLYASIDLIFTSFLRANAGESKHI
jgi:hypothetical protein